MVLPMGDPKTVDRVDAELGTGPAYEHLDPEITTEEKEQRGIVYYGSVGGFLVLSSAVIVCFDRILSINRFPREHHLLSIIAALSIVIFTRSMVYFRDSHPWYLCLRALWMASLLLNIGIVSTYYDAPTVVKVLAGPGLAVLIFICVATLKIVRRLDRTGVLFCQNKKGELVSSSKPLLDSNNQVV